MPGSDAPDLALGPPRHGADAPATGLKGWRPEPARPVPDASVLVHPELQALYDFWSSRSIGGVVARQDLDVLDLGRWLGWLIMLDVLDGGADFLCRVHGTNLAQYFGYDMTGKRLGERLPERHRAAALAEYGLVAAHAQPTMVSILERHGTVWTRWEKLMLPLGRPGTVQHVLSGLYRISAGGTAREIAPPVRPDPLPLRHPRLQELLAFWQAKAAGGSLPARTDIDVLDLKPWLGHVSLLQVVDGGMDFRYRVHGSELVVGIGLEMTGKLLSNSPSLLWRTAADEYRACVESGEPVRFAKIYRPGRLYNGWEKLILPLSATGAGVDFLLVGIYPPGRG